jgi:hypothetical protein
MEPVTIVGFLVATLLGAAQRLADRKLDDLLTGLADRVFGRLGSDPALDDLQNNPQDPRAQRNAAAVIDAAARKDHRYRAELTRLQHELDRRGARKLVQYAPGAETVIGINHGVVDHDGNVYMTWEDPFTIRRDPAWVKVAFVVATLFFLVGFAIVGVAMFQTGSRGPGPAIIPGAVIFFLGLVILAIASLGRSMSNPARRPVRWPPIRQARTR